MSKLNESESKIIWTKEAQDRLREQINKIIEEEKLNKKQVSDEMGMKYGTFTSWINGTYNVDSKTNDSGAEQSEVANRWVETRRERKKVALTMPDAPSFQNTLSAKKMFSLFTYCQHAPDIGVLAGGPGIGKTSAAEAFQRSSSNVFILTAEPVMRSPRAFLQEMGQVLGIMEGSSNRLSRAICQKLKGAKALLIIDEAQHLTTQTLDQVRALHDRARCGLVFAGNESVNSRMGGGRAEFAQISSRIGMSVNQKYPATQDVDAIVEAWGLSFDKKLTHAIARKPGALRGLTKSIRLAHVLAAGKGEEPTSEHLKEAFEKLNNQMSQAA